MRKVFISVLALALWAYVIQAQAPQTQATRTTTAAPTYTTGTYNPLSTDTSGNLRTAIAATVTINTSDLATSANQVTGNASLSTIAGAVSGTEVQVDIVTSALPTGAATAANQTTGNTSLSTIAGAVSGTEMQVDVLTSALPTGASTAANQTTANTSLSTIAGAVSGTEMQVDVLTLPAITGTVTANAGTNLNTSALALEAGNLATIAGTVSGTEVQVDVLTMPSVTIGTFPDNEPFNLAQVNGTTTDDGNGAVGTGTLRIVQGSGSTVSSCADETQVTSVVISTATSGNVELVAISGTTVVFVCGFNVIAGGTVGVQFISGTGSACATGETNKTGVYPLVVNSGIAVGNGGAMQFKGAAGEAVCVELSAAVHIDGLLTYVQR